MDQNVRIISLAGLLHDIGKIAYRSGQGNGTHSERGRDLLAKCLPQPQCEDLRVLPDRISCHHATNLHRIKHKSHPAYIVYEADNIAAGMDRRKEEGGSGGFDSKAPLESVFVRLNGRGKNQAYYLRGLAESARINYPADAASIAATPDKYAALLTTLQANLQQTDFATCSVNEVLKIMEALSSYIPSSTNREEAGDISLYDHSRITAALAAAMLQYFTEAGITDYQAWCVGEKNAQFRAMPVFLIVSGDMSGIQKFIYTIPSAGALKSLRGRSFYLEILLEHVADEILTAADLSRANLLYTGGGHFHILAPNTQSMRILLQDCMDKVNSWLLERFGTGLYLQMAWQPASADDLMNKASSPGAVENRSGDIFRALSAKLAAGKLQRYTSAQLAALFAPYSDINRAQDTARECSVCHASVARLQKFRANESTYICPQCNSLYTFGEQLLQEDGILAVMPQGAAEGLELPALDGKPLVLAVLDTKTAAAKDKQGLIRRLYVKNAMQTGGLLATHLWVGDYAARQDNKTVMDFKELAAASSGIKRLAVLRADVDNLGATFIAGFEQPDAEERYKYVTISRYATLSRQLSLFFKGHINSFCAGLLSGEDGQTVEPFDLWGRRAGQRHAAIVYSGGDDMFIVGAWDDIIGLAIDLRRGFQRFSCGKLTFSAGIALFPHNYPVAHMADLTGDLEEAAKAQPGKDSIALFGLDKTCTAAGTAPSCRHVYHWDDFINGVVGEKLAFLRRTLNFSEDNAAVGASGRLPAGKSLLYKLLSLFDVDEDQRDKMDIARLAYMLARLEPRWKDEATMQDYEEFRRHIYKWFSQEPDRRQMATALHLLIYGLRRQEED